MLELVGIYLLCADTFVTLLINIIVLQTHRTVRRQGRARGHSAVVVQRLQHEARCGQFVNNSTVGTWRVIEVPQDDAR